MIAQNGSSSDQGEGIVGLLLRLRAHGIQDAQFLKAIESVPRDRFVPPEFHNLAWADTHLPIACGQTMPSPDMLVRMVDALNLDPGHAVLEIGTGSGYLTALLARLSRKVTSIDRYVSLLDQARRKLTALKYSNIALEQRDGSASAPGGSLFDRIIVDSAYESMPRAMLDHLAAEGVMVTAIGPVGGEQMLVRLTKIGSRFEREDLFPVRFTGLVGSVARAL